MSPVYPFSCPLSQTELRIGKLCTAHGGPDKWRIDCVARSVFFSLCAPGPPLFPICLRSAQTNPSQKLRWAVGRDAGWQPLPEQIVFLQLLILFIRFQIQFEKNTIHAGTVYFIIYRKTGGLQRKNQNVTYPIFVCRLQHPAFGVVFSFQLSPALKKQRQGVSVPQRV